jgi:hypothetical protein
MNEQQIEQGLITKLRDLKYTHRPDIHDRAALEQNFREKFETLNRVHLTDNEFSRLMEQIALGIQDQALAEITRHLVDFIGSHTWEELCREWTLRAGGQGALPFLPDQVGSTWDAGAQVDVVGLNRMEKTLVLGECKWGERPCERPVLAGLVEKAERFVPAVGRWQVVFVGFARRGWTSGAQRYAEQVESSPLAGKNWDSAGMLLLDLEQVDQDLAAWVG